MNHPEPLSREAIRRASVRHMDWPTVIEAAQSCARTCRSDADACASEPDPGALKACAAAAVAAAEEHDHFAETRPNSRLVAEACRATLAVLEEVISDAGLRYA